MKNALMRWSLIFVSFTPFLVWGDIDHYKTILIGGRAATMGGAYTAISDDATGSFYNPGGLAMSQGDNFSGSAKIYSSTRTRYKEAIGHHDWVRESDNLFANFFGIVKRYQKHAFGLSYAVPMAVVEHQDQTYTNLTEVVNPISLWSYNLHVEDTVNLVGASYSYRFTDNFSMGATLYYYSRTFRRNFHSLIKYVDGEDESYFKNSTYKLKGIKPKVGLIWNPLEKVSLGITYAMTHLTSGNSEYQQDMQAVKGSSTHLYESIDTKVNPKMPHELSLGVAFFPSPYFLISFDTDIYRSRNSNERDVVNFSLGTEYYLNGSNAVRFGGYTNNTKNPQISNRTQTENINMYGGTLGWTLFSGESSITLGGIYTIGNGEAQIYSGSSSTRKMSRSSYTLITSADYGF